MKYVVTGGAGFIGSYIVEAVAGSHEVVVIDNLMSAERVNVPNDPRVRFIPESITRDQVLAQLHLARRSGHVGPTRHALP